MQENVKLSLKARRNIMGYLFITPAFIFFVGFSVLPIILAVTWSFTNYNGIDKMDFIGFKAYEFAFKDAYFLETFKNIFRYVIIAVPLSIIVPLLLALLLNIDQKGSKAFTAIYYLPGLVSAIAASAIFSYVEILIQTVPSQFVLMLYVLLYHHKMLAYHRFL